MGVRPTYSIFKVITSTAKMGSVVRNWQLPQATPAVSFCSPVLSFCLLASPWLQQNRLF